MNRREALAFVNDDSVTEMIEKAKVTESIALRTMFFTCFKSNGVGFKK